MGLNSMVNTVEIGTIIATAHVPLMCYKLITAIVVRPAYQTILSLFFIYNVVKLVSNELQCY